MPKILIVDDDRTTVKLLQTLLEMDGFEVLMAARGQTAIELARENRPDIILVDYHLADMKGSELVSRFRSESAFVELPIVMASGLDMEEAARQAGANAFLIKPFEPGELAAMFYGLLG